MTPPVDLPVALEPLLTGINQHFQEQGRSWVTLSYAQSLDGSIAARRGSPLVLSGSATLEITHHLRSRHAAILVGIGTLLADDPQLTVRLVPGEDPQPVVLDSQLRFPLDARLLQTTKSPWIMASRNASADREFALVQAGARVFRTAAERVNLGEVLAFLAREGIPSVMVEGGARVITSFLQARLVDLIVLTIAPRFVGGLQGVETLLADHGPRLVEFGVQRYEDDLLVWGRPRWALGD
jgi:GTP cyclohydrolase II